MQQSPQTEARDPDIDRDRRRDGEKEMHIHVPQGVRGDFGKRSTRNILSLTHPHTPVIVAVRRNGLQRLGSQYSLRRSIASPTSFAA